LQDHLRGLLEVERREYGGHHGIELREDASVESYQDIVLLYSDGGGHGAVCHRDHHCLRLRGSRQVCSKSCPARGGLLW
jgi:hypothetical protein